MTMNLSGASRHQPKDNGEFPESRPRAQLRLCLLEGAGAALMTASEQVMARKWEYRVTEPNLPLGAKSPVMDSQQMQEWLNRMDDYGWEFVGYGATHWRGYSVPQEWWIFRRPVQS